MFCISNRRCLEKAAFAGLLLFLCVGGLGATEVEMRIMPAPPSPEADFSPESVHGWDFSIGYGHIWRKDSSDANLNGFVAGVIWQGCIGSRFGITLAPLYGGMYFGEVAGYDADTTSVGTGFSFGSRILGKAETSNLILFGGGGYSYALDREDDSLGSYKIDSNMFGFSVGAKVQISFHRFVRITPFYLYMGGGGTWSTAVTIGATVYDNGSLGYQDIHLFGLDFFIFGVSAKLVADLFREDYRSFTISISIPGTIRGVKTARVNLAARRDAE